MKLNAPQRILVAIAAASIELTSPTQITFRPGGALEYGTAYTVTVSTAVTDPLLNPLGKDAAAPSGEDHVFTFTTWQELAGFAKGSGCEPGACLCGGRQAGGPSPGLVALMAAVATLAVMRRRLRGVRARS